MVLFLTPFPRKILVVKALVIQFELKIIKFWRVDGDRVWLYSRRVNFAPKYHTFACFNKYKAITSKERA